MQSAQQYRYVIGVLVLPGAFLISLIFGPFIGAIGMLFRLHEYIWSRIYEYISCRKYHPRISNIQYAESMVNQKYPFTTELSPVDYEETYFKREAYMNQYRYGLLSSPGWIWVMAYGVLVFLLGAPFMIIGGLFWGPIYLIRYFIEVWQIKVLGHNYMGGLV